MPGIGEGFGAGLPRIATSPQPLLLPKAVIEELSAHREAGAEVRLLQVQLRE